MNITLIVLLLVAALATVLACAWLYRKRETILMANTNVAPIAGRHSDGRITKLADAAIGRYYLVKAGSDANHVAVSAAATDTVIGVTEDEATAAEDAISIASIPGATGTLLAVAGAAITAGVLIQSNGDGKVKTAVGTGYACGRALTAASGDGDLIEFAPLWKGVAES